MAYLESLSDEEKALICALPYRAGLWVSMSDSSGGDSADQAELDALASIVTGFVEDFCKSELVEEVMRGTLARKSEWDKWADNIHTLPEECRRAIELLALRVDYRQVSSFKSSLVDIAMTVAMAFREYADDIPLAEKVRIYTRYWMKWLECRIHKEQAPIFDQFLNISQQEHKAIKSLSEALRLKEVEGLEPQDESNAA